MNIDVLEAVGWLVIPAAIPESLLDRVTGQLDRSHGIRDVIRRRNGIEGENDGTLHHLVGDHPAYLDVLASYERFGPMINAFFGGRFILNSFGGVINRRGSRAYVHQVHRDIRFAAPTRRFMLNSLVMLDDFTEDNGATYLLGGSHRMPARPQQRQFEEQASRATGKRGSIMFFDSRIWHAAGANVTNTPRRALTITFTSPFFKQQCDYPRMLGYDRADLLSPFMRQLIGYNARVPATLDEFYRPIAGRFYQRGQDDDE